MLLNEIKEVLSKWRDMLYSWIRWLCIRRMSICPNWFIYRMRFLPKSQSTFFINTQSCSEILSKWWNRRVFFSILLPNNTSFDIRWWDFVEVQETSGEFPAHCWRKKKKKSRLSTLKKVRGSFTLSALPLPQGGTAQWSDDLGRWFLPWGKREDVNEHLASSAVQDFAVEIKTVQFWNKKEYLDQWNRIKSPVIKPCLYSQLIFDKGAEIIQGGKDRLFMKWCWEN